MFDSFANLQGIVVAGALFLFALVLIPTALRSFDSMATGVLEKEHCVSGGEPFVHVFEEAGWENGQPAPGATPVKVAGASDKCDLPSVTPVPRPSTPTPYAPNNYYTPMGQELPYLDATPDQISGAEWRTQPGTIGRQAGITGTFLKLLPMVFLIGGLVAAWAGWAGMQRTRRLSEVRCHV